MLRGTLTGCSHLFTNTTKRVSSRFINLTHYPAAAQRLLYIAKLAPRSCMHFFHALRTLLRRFEKGGLPSVDSFNRKPRSSCR